MHRSLIVHEVGQEASDHDRNMNQGLATSPWVIFRLLLSLSGTYSLDFLTCTFFLFYSLLFKIRNWSESWWCLPWSIEITRLYYLAITDIRCFQRGHLIYLLCALRIELRTSKVLCVCSTTDLSPFLVLLTAVCTPGTQCFADSDLSVSSV